MSQETGNVSQGYLCAKYKMCRCTSTVAIKTNFKIQSLIFMLKTVDDIFSLKFVFYQFFIDKFYKVPCVCARVYVYILMNL